MIERLAEVSGHAVSRETFALLERYADLLRDEAAKQNLVSASTLDSLWERHILDSAQLVQFEPRVEASWVDIGSGAGLPGIVIAALVRGPVLLVEPRRLRAEFLERTVATLGMANRVSVALAKVEKVTGSFEVLTARAVANLDRLLRISTHLSTRKSLWVLPKGRSAQSELADARRNWHCDSTSVPSSTDPESEILVLRSVKARGGR
jgi:16S rRNA (guanine527-N7)-methyltransferase